MTRKYYAAFIVLGSLIAFLLALLYLRYSERKPPTSPYVPSPILKASPTPSVRPSPSIQPSPIQKKSISRAQVQRETPEPTPTHWTNVAGYERVYYGPAEIDGYQLGAGLKAIPTTITGDHPLLCPSNPLKLNPCMVILPGVKLMISQCFKQVPCLECSKSLPTKLVFEPSCEEERVGH